MSNVYTPFRADFPGFALIDALSVIKDGAVSSPAGRLQLAHSAFDLASWALHTTLEADQALMAADNMHHGLSDEQAMNLLESLETASVETTDEARFGGFPITPALALKLAGWLLKLAEVVIPVLV